MSVWILSCIPGRDKTRTGLNLEKCLAKTKNDGPLCMAERQLVEAVYCTGLPYTAGSWQRNKCHGSPI